jgi:hypothetical protein
VNGDAVARSAFGASFGVAEPRRATSYADEAGAWIKRWILDGTLASGTHVSPERIAAALNMSRGPVREALVGLDREGWIRFERLRGAFVRALDESTVRDQYAMAASFFGIAVGRLVASGDAATRGDVAALVRQLDGGRRPGAGVAVAFHLTVLGAASPRVGIAVRTALGYDPEDMFDVVPAAAALHLDGLAPIGRALLACHAAGAADGYVDLMHGTADLLVEQYRERGVLRAVPSPTTRPRPWSADADRA